MCILSNLQFDRIAERIRNKKRTLIMTSKCVYPACTQVPVYNKRMFNPHIFPYPITTAAIQLVMVAFVLGVISILKHYLLDKPVATPSDTLSVRCPAL